MDTEKEKYFFDEYMAEGLEAVINRQQKITEYQKKNGHKQLHSIFIIVDDFADSQDFSKKIHLC